MKTVRFLLCISSIFILIGFFGCNRTKNVQQQEGQQGKQAGSQSEKQKGGSWEKDMDKLIEKATPKEGEK